MEKTKFPRRLYTKGEEPQFGKSISYYSNDSKLFPALEEVLQEDEWKELLESQLGVFLKFYKLKFGWASRVVQYILGFQLVCKKRYEIWSLVDANPLRFSLNEFEELTGLNCEYDPALEDQKVTPEMELFWEKLGVRVDVGPSVDDLTEACKHAGDWTRDDRIRLGLLSIYAGFIEAKKRDSPTRLDYARLVLDVESFANYPWGRVAFKFLIESVKKADLTKTCLIYGFAEVLQVWAYYAMPDFGTKFGNPFPNNPTPPVLAYGGCRGRKYIKEAMLKQVSFNNSTMKERGEMFPIWDDEVADPLIENIIKAIFGELGVGKWNWKSCDWRSEGVKESNVVKLEATKGQKRGVHSDDESRKKSCPSPSIDDDVLKSLVETMKQHVSACCMKLSEEMNVGFAACDKKFGLVTDKVAAVEQTIAKIKEARNEESSAGRKKQAEVEQSVVYVGRGKPSQKDVCVMLMKQRYKKTAKIVARAKADYNLKRAAASTVKGAEKANVGGGYDPFAPIDGVKKKALNDWLKRLPRWPARDLKKFPINRWWWQLRTPQQWLVDTHMDAGINLLRYRFTKHPEWFRSDRICFLDSLLGMMWKIKYTEFLAIEPNPDGSGRLLPPGTLDYYNGAIPEYCRTDKKWGIDIDDIYMPLHVKGDHWVVGHAKDEELAKAVEPIAVMMPYLLREMASREEKDKFPATAFTHTRVDGERVPQQQIAGDCGVFCLKFIEYHALGLPFPSTLCLVNMKDHRLKLAIDIFHEINCRGPSEDRDWASIGLYEGT